MPRASMSRTRSARLQIRVSIDEYMEDLYPWLSAMPPTLRGRELVTQARVARALATSSNRASLPLDPSAVSSTAVGTRSTEEQEVSLGDRAVAQARARLDFGFLSAVPPLG